MVKQTSLFDFRRFPELITERLVLREIVMNDVDDIFTLRSDEQVTRLNIGDPYTTREQAERLVQRMRELYNARQELRWGISLQHDSTVIGIIGYNYWDRVDHRASVGFDLARAHWRQGIMSEALQAVIRFGFTRMGLNRIEADASIYNDASITLLLRSGFKQEGHQREQYYENAIYHDLLLFALLKKEWLNGQG